MRESRRLGARGGRSRMEFLQGFTECWWPGPSCKVWWEAWAAIGTVAAVFTAVLAPEIHRLWIRRRANAVFAAAYLDSIMKAAVHLAFLGSHYPVGAERDDAWAAEGFLSTFQDSRLEFQRLAGRLSVLARREVDLSKWPAVDLDLAGEVVLAIAAVQHVVDIGNEMVSGVDGSTEYWQAVRGFMDEAGFALTRAEAALKKAVGAFERERRRGGG